MCIRDRYKNDKSSSIVMNPKTGEVLAMVSTPTFNSMDFVLGMSQEKWDSLNNDEDKPLYNRTRESWVPGSSFKPVIGAVGLTTGTLSDVYKRQAYLCIAKLVAGHAVNSNNK